MGSFLTKKKVQKEYSEDELLDVMKEDAKNGDFMTIIYKKEMLHDMKSSINKLPAKS